MVLKGMGKIYSIIRQQIYCGHREAGHGDMILCVLWSLKHPNIQQDCDNSVWHPERHFKTIYFLCYFPTF